MQYILSYDPLVNISNSYGSHLKISAQTSDEAADKCASKSSLQTISNIFSELFYLIIILHYYYNYTLCFAVIKQLGGDGVRT